VRTRNCQIPPLPCRKKISLNITSSISVTVSRPVGALERNPHGGKLRQVIVYTSTRVQIDAR
jgi:hypothetical protein